MARGPISTLLALSWLPAYADSFAFRPSARHAPTLKPRSLSSALSSTALVSPPAPSFDDAAIDDATISDAAASVDTTSGFWKWRGHDIFTEVRTPSVESGNDKKPSVILLHGFGASTTYWRETMAVLQSEGYDVHALDLLGQGRSSKPYLREEKTSFSLPYRLYINEDEESDDDHNTAVDLPPGMEIGKHTDADVEYSINMWGQMVDDYARHHQLDEVVLMGNSIGSLVALSAATGDFIESTSDRENLFSYLAGNSKGERSRVKGLCLFNCGVGLNSQNVLKNPNLNAFQRTIFGWLFDALNGLIFGNKPLLRFALNNVVTKELLEDALKSLYIVSPERVDSELVDSFYYPAKTGGEGAVEAIRQIYTNDAGKTPMEYHEMYPMLDSLPLHLIWGLDDAVTPIEGDVGLFYCDRVANNRGGKGMTSLDYLNAGHMPFDDNPDEAHESMLRWMNKRIVK